MDYYHACEHLHAFTNNYFKDRNVGQSWVKKQKELLLQSEVYTVIENIKELADENKDAQNLIAYYEGNKERMDYKRYQQIGCGILGS